MRAVIAICFAFGAGPVMAETVFAQKTIRPREMITAEAIHLQDVRVAGGARTLEDVIGSEVKHAVYAGRPILSGNLVKAALIERNQVATAVFVLNGLTITTEARALERGAAGDVIRAMNLSSKSTLRTEVLADGSLKVLP